MIPNPPAKRGLIILTICIGWLVNIMCVQAFDPAEDAETIDVGIDLELLSKVEEEPELPTSDILAAVNRWHSELYPGSPAAAVAYMLAVVMDPYTEAWAEELAAAADVAETLDDRIQAMFDWLQDRMCHTQMTGVFQDRPGLDPWGVRADGGPTYKKLLPSEMQAMSIHTGKISGKCITLANLVSSLFLHMGVRPENIVHVLLRLPNGYRHGNALIDYDGTILLVNNNAVGRFLIEPGQGAPPQAGEAVYNHTDFNALSFVVATDSIRDVLWDSRLSLIDRVLVNFRFDELQLRFGNNMPLPVSDPKSLRRRVFEEMDLSPQACLARYAYQSLYVNHPELYLRASTRVSQPRTLALSLDGPGAVFCWIEENISEGSIFPDGGERLMTADQVLVFRQGSVKDRAVLAATLLHHLGYSICVSIAENTSFVTYDGPIIDVRTGEGVERISEDVLLELRID